MSQFSVFPSLLHIICTCHRHVFFFGCHILFEYSGQWLNPWLILEVVATQKRPYLLYDRWQQDRIQSCIFKVEKSKISFEIAIYQTFDQEYDLINGMHETKHKTLLVILYY